jgi:hypothetical protein
VRQRNKVAIILGIIPVSSSFLSLPLSPHTMQCMGGKWGYFEKLSEGSETLHGALSTKNMMIPNPKQNGNNNNNNLTLFELKIYYDESLYSLIHFETDRKVVLSLSSFIIKFLILSLNCRLGLGETLDLELDYDESLYCPAWSKSKSKA